MDFEVWQVMKDRVKRDRGSVPGVEDKLPALTSVSWAFDGQGVRGGGQSDLNFPLDFPDNLTQTWVWCQTQWHPSMTVILEILMNSLAFRRESAFLVTLLSNKSCIKLGIWKSEKQGRRSKKRETFDTVKLRLNNGLKQPPIWHSTSKEKHFRIVIVLGWPTSLVLSL